MDRSDPPRSEGSDKGLSWLGRWVARVARHGLRSHLERVRANEQALERIAAAHHELQEHLEARIDQAVAEVADLRDAFLATRVDVESLRDEDVPRLREALESLRADLDARAGELSTRHAAVGARLDGVEPRVDAVASGIEELRSELRSIRGIDNESRFATVERDLRMAHDGIVRLQEELAEVRDRRLSSLGADVEEAHRSLESVQSEMEGVRDTTLPALAAELAGAHRSLVAIQAEVEGVRDERLPALSGRVDALVSRLYEEVERTGGLVDRMLAGEPLRIAAEPDAEAELPEAFRAASRSFTESFRGPRPEIVGRMEEIVPLVEGSAPVLDLGCGRGELLELLQQRGVEARGVDADPSMVATCRARGLAVEEGDALEWLRSAERGSLGAVTAVHIVEHLPAATWLGIVEAARDALKAGGVLVVESPNPESLRVGAGLYWIDPTHRFPVHPEAVAFAMRACGLVDVATELVHPFPADQSLAAPDQSDEVRRLAERLDAWLSGPRDFRVVGRRPE